MEDSKSRILVVDDEVFNVELMEGLLCTKYEVVTAFNGVEALEIINQEFPDLVLLDIMMPGMNGFEVCKRIKQNHETSMIPVVMVTALKEKEERIKALEVGADDFLSKPVDRTELMVRVKSLLRIKKLYDELSEINKNLEQKVQEQVERLQDLTRLEEEIKIAQEIQHKFLPEAPPECQGYSIFGDCVTAYAVGGDYYDFVETGNGDIGIVIADVSGKGYSAALMMSNLQAMLRTSMGQNLSPCEMVVLLNKLVHQSSPPDRFITFFYGQLNPETGSFSYINAGHNPPILFSTGEEISELQKGGIMLGVLPEFPYEEGCIRLKEGETIVLYTDGVTETMNAEEEEFGTERLVELVKSNYQKKPEVLSSLIMRSVKEFDVDGQQDDDITIVIIKKE